MTRGWVLETLCNYPEATLLGKVLIQNNTVTMKGPKLVTDFNAYLSNTGPFNITFRDSKVVT